MIRPIETHETPEATPQRHAQKTAGPEGAAGSSFASMLARQGRSAGEQASAAEAAKRTAKGGPIEAPDGERWRPVRGDDDYARIMNGPRKGMYINLSRGDRRGEVFHVEQRDGKRVHVYGEGKDEEVVLARKDTGKVHGDEDGGGVRAARREIWAPVEGANNYADILSGPRNGYFVNTSGGERDGMVFHRVQRDGKIFHIYGAGKHRQVVEVGPADDDKPRRAERTERNGDKPGGADAASGTGGASPDSPRQAGHTGRD